jgi:hypothetical protein
MLILPLKPAVRYDLSLALAKWLDDDDLQVSFQPANPLQFILPKPDFSSTACRQDLIRLQSLRNCISDCILKPGSHVHALEERALEDLQEYHAVLLEFEKRGFPTIDDDTIPIHIVWKDAFHQSQQEEHATLIWERACTMFNIVALLTQKAHDTSVTDRESCKQAVGYCQQAASLLSILRELTSSQQLRPFATVDLSDGMLQFWEKVLIAHAQDFIYRMASLAPASTDPGQQHNTLAKLAQSTFLLFKQALTAAQDPRLESELPQQSQEWGAHCKAASMLAAAKAKYHQSVGYRVTAAWGKEIAALKDCQEKLEALRDFLKPLETTSTNYTNRECTAILPVVTDRLHEADRDNYKIYQEEIPSKLPEIEAKQLAKINPELPTHMLVPKIALFTNVKR